MSATGRTPAAASESWQSPLTVRGTLAAGRRGRLGKRSTASAVLLAYRAWRRARSRKSAGWLGPAGK